MMWLEWQERIRTSSRALCRMAGIGKLEINILVEGSGTKVICSSFKATVKHSVI